MKHKPVKPDNRKTWVARQGQHKTGTARPLITKPASAKPVNSNQDGDTLSPSKQAESLLSFFYALILLGYSLVTVLTPNMNTLDSNGPKFLTLSILNLAAFTIILIGGRMRPSQSLFGSFFPNRIGFIYTLFLLISLSSLFIAINVNESILNLSKLFTVFSAALIVSVILKQHKRYLYLISAVLVLLLIFDSLTVFYSIIVKRMDYSSIISIYSNKNILASAIFVKIAFLLWFIAFGRWWMKVPGFMILILALLALLYMQTRSFLIGSVVLLMTYVLFMIIRFYKNSSKLKAILFTVFFPLVVIAVLLAFSAAMKYRNPESKISLMTGYTVFTDRLKTLSQEKAGVRAKALLHSAVLISEHPLRGVGTGNWKVQVLKYEGPETGEHIYMYKNHNDFLENFAETGIFGGLLFIGIFILVFFNFIKAFFKAKKGEAESYKWLFLPAFGLFCYSFDAMFNFPADRPEIAAFFAIFVGAGIAFSPPTLFKKLYAFLNRTQQSVKKKKGPQPYQLMIPFTSHTFHVAVSLIFITLLLTSVYILNLNFESLKLQRIAKQELLSGTLTTSSEKFVTGFPAIPDIGCEGVPIAVVKGRYLIVEGKYQQALDILKQDHSSPWDTRPEFFIAIAYTMLGQPDSALKYTNKVYAMKPYFSKNISVMSSALEAKGNLTEALKVLDDHVALNTKNGIPIEGVIYQQQTALKGKLKR